MKLHFVVMTILIALGANAQISVNGIFYSGIGKMSNSYEKEWFTYDTAFKTSYSPTYGGGLEVFIPLELKRVNFGQFRIKSGLTYDFIESNQKESLKAQDFYTGEEVHIIAEKRYAAHYLRLPICLEYSIHKLNLSFGGQLGYRITNSAWSKYYTEEANGSIGYGINAVFSSTGNNLSTLDFGIVSQLGIQVHERLNIFLGMYNGLLDIGNNSDRGIKNEILNMESVVDEPRVMRNLQFKMGVSFNLF